MNMRYHKDIIWKGFVRRNIALISFIFLFILIKIFFLLEFHEFFWDESVYIGIGKYIFSLGHIGIWESIRPPLLPLLLGAIWKSGLDVSTASEILIILFSCGVLFMTYLIAAEIFDRKVGFISAFLIAFTPIFFKFSSLVMTGIPSAFFALLAVYLYIRGRSLFLVGLSACLSFLTRYPQGLILLSLGILIALSSIGQIKSRKKEAFIALSRKLTHFSSGILLIFTPFIIFNYFMYKDVTSQLSHTLFRPFLLAFRHQANIHESVNGFLQNYFYYFIGLFQQNYLLAFSLLGVIITLCLKRYRARILPVLLPLVFYLLYFSFIVNKQMRFSLVFLPLVSIFAAFGMIELLKYTLKMKSFFKYAIYIILLLAVVTSYGPIIRQDWNIYYYLPPVQTEIVTDFYYGYIHDLDEPILTSDPTSLAYIDKLMIAYYSTNIEGPKIYDKYKEKAGSIIFHPSVYPCADSDALCRERNKAFFERLNSENRLVSVKEYYGERYYVFRLV